jgi:NAD-dependent dihydropyrimidine dehydrogenase PreA subunit
MASLFIDVKVDAEVASDANLVAKLVEVCPVSIFGVKQGGGLAIVEENLDECTLCDLCIEVAPGGVKVIKLYE